MKKIISSLFLFGLVLLTLSALSFLFGHQGFGLKIVSLTYFIFAGAFIAYILDLKNEKS